jgi:hypothetical protein
MKEWFEIVATLFSRIGTLGFFLLVFSYGAIFAENRGAALPTLVREWSTVDCLLGLAMLATSIAVGAAKLAGGILDTIGAIVVPRVSCPGLRPRENAA